MPFGSAVAALATGLSRDALATYIPAFIIAGIACLLATLVLLAVQPAVAWAAE